MFMNNCVHLLGRIGREPEIRTTQSGDRVATLSVVTSDVYRDKDSGEWKERPEWHRVTVWGEGSVKHVEKNAAAGAQIAVMGQLRTRKWVKDGEERYSTEVVADFRAGGQVQITPKPDRTDAASDEQASASSSRGAKRGGRGRQAQAEQAVTADLADDIPF